jgi:GDP-mannose pyrophosphatase NudK
MENSMAQVRIKNEKILSDEQYVLKRIDFDIQKKNGEWESQKREVFDHGNAATVLLYNPAEKTIVLTRQFRIPAYLNGHHNGMLTEAPAGMLEESESPEATIIREIREETGFEIENVEKIFEAYSSPGAFTELIHYYIAPYSKEQKTGEGGGLAEEGEEVNTMELPFAEALRMLEAGEIKDAKTILLLQYAQLKNIIP